MIGLAGYATTFLTGLLFLSRQVKTVAGVMERDGGTSPAAVAETKRLLIGRVDLVVLYTVVLDMALKPRSEDVGTLALMAAAVLGAAAYSTWRFRVPAPTAA